MPGRRGDDGEVDPVHQGRALADPRLAASPAFYEALADSLRDQHPDLRSKAIRILAVTLPAVAEWDETMRPFRRWHRVDFEVREAT